MKEKIICVEWDDATYNSGYYDEKSPEQYTVTQTRTVGHQIKRTSQAVILSMERFYTDKKTPCDDRRIVTIPKKMIRKIVELK